MATVKDPGIDLHRQQLRDVERKLAQALQERDDLARDLEAMCLDAEPATFSASSVLRERIFATEKELSRTKGELREVTYERNSLSDDLREVREAKRVADQSFRQQAARLAALERELGFYRQQAAQAIADRDSASWETEQLRLQNLELQAAAQEANARAEDAKNRRLETDRRLQQAEKRAASLEVAARAAEALPALRAELENARARIVAAEKARDKALGEAVSAKDEAQRANEESKEAVGAAERRLQAAQIEVAEAREELEEVACQKVEVLVRLSRSEEEKSQANRELLDLRESLQQTKAELEEATQQKVQALMQVAALQQAEPGSPEGSAASKSPLGSGRSAGSGASPIKPAGVPTNERWSWFGGNAAKATTTP